MKNARYLPSVAAVVVALFSPASFADNADIRFSIGDVSFGIDVGTPPPAPIVEYVPVAMPGHIWSPGYWAWDGQRHSWHGGTWQRARPGYSHVAGHWEPRGERWHFEPSRWEAHGSAERHGARRYYAERARYEDHHDHGGSRERDARRDQSGERRW